MEEARQHSTIAVLRKLSVGLYIGSFAAFLAGILGQVIFRGHWLQVGLTAFPVFKFLAWTLAMPEAVRLGAKKKWAVIANAAIWLVLALVIGLGVNAVTIWGR